MQHPYRFSLVPRGAVARTKSRVAVRSLVEWLPSLPIPWMTPRG